MTEYVRIPIRADEHKRLVALQTEWTGQINSYLTRPSLSDVIKKLLDERKAIDSMTTQLKVESAIERDLGTKFEIRFWLSTEINGRKAESRGTVVTVEKPTVADAREFARRIGYTISGKIFNNQWTAANAKEANVALPNLVNEAIAEDAEFHTAFNSFAE